MDSPSVVQFGKFRVDSAKRLLLRDGQVVPLTPKAFDALLLLIERRNRVVSKQELLDELWPDTAVEEATLSQHIFMLRRALTEPDRPGSTHIATSPRRGYRFATPVTGIDRDCDSDYPPDRLLEAARATQIAGTNQRGWRSHRPVWAVPSLFTASLIAAFAAAWYLRAAPTQQTIRLTLALPAEQRLWRTGRGGPAISRDGTVVAYAAGGQLYVRQLDESQPHRVSGTDLDAGVPFFSPDGAWIGFWSGHDSTLKKIRLSGGTAVTIAPASNPRGASWYSDRIVFADGAKGIMVARDSGGRPEQWTPPGSDEVLWSPQILPGNDSVLFTAGRVTGNRITTSDVVAYTHATGARKIVISNASVARYLPTGTILFASGRTLFAAPFNLRHLTLSGTPRLIGEGVDTSTGYFDVSAGGTLIYVPRDDDQRSAERSIVLVEPTGEIQPLALPRARYETLRVSPGGAELAVGTDDAGGTIWIHQLRHAGSLRRLTFRGRARSPVWSPEGRQIAFSSTPDDGAAGMFVQATDGKGTAERITSAPSGFEHVPESWSPDGRLIVFSSVKAGVKDTIWMADVRTRRAERLIAVPGSNQMDPRLSPDGHWIAFSSEGEAGESTLQVYVQPFPPTGAKYQVSRRGGDMPVWSRDGRRLYYRVRDPQGFASVSVSANGSLSFGDPVLIPVQQLTLDAGYDVAPDGRILLPVEVTMRRSYEQINVVLNWFGQYASVRARWDARVEPATSGLP